MANILVVDDYRDTADSMAMWLKQLGHNTQVARDGYQALELARSHRPDVVLLDIGLPRLDGYHVAAALRQELAGPLVIIAVTGYGYENDRQKALAAGCDHHLLKPVDCDALVSLLAAPNADLHDPLQNGPLTEVTSREEGSPCPFTRKVEVTNSLGLHLRAADMFVRLAGKFRAEIRVSCGDHTANGRSILELTTLAAAAVPCWNFGQTVLTPKRPLDGLVGLIGRRFDEESEAAQSMPRPADRKLDRSENGTRGVAPTL